MSLRGIDAQIMVNRSNDLSPTSVKAMREHDINQNAIAQQDNKMAERNLTRTMAVNRTEFNSVSLQHEGGGGGAGNQTASERKKKNEEKEENIMAKAPEGEHKIDIKI